MNRVVIKLNEHGEFDGVASDEPIEFFVYDPNCENEPIYQYNMSECIGVHKVKNILKNLPIGYGGEDVLVDYKSSKPSIKIINND